MAESAIKPFPYPKQKRPDILSFYFSLTQFWFLVPDSNPI